MYVWLCFFSDSSTEIFYHTLTCSVSCYITRPLKADFQKLLLSLWYLAVREEEYVWTSPLVLLPVESCAIHLCQPLYQLGPLCVYIKLIDEQFIRLMGTAGADKHPATKSVFKIQPKFSVALHWLQQYFSMTLQVNFLNVEMHYS